MVLLRKNYVTVILDCDRGFLYQKWKGPVSPSDFRRAIDFSMDTIDACGITSIISDVTEQDEVSSDEQAYVKDEVIRFLGDNRCFRLAFVAHKDSPVASCVKLYDSLLQKEKVPGVNRLFETYQ